MEPAATMPEGSQRSTSPMNSHLDMDMAQKENKGLDEAHRPTMDSKFVVLFFLSLFIYFGAGCCCLGLSS